MVNTLFSTYPPAVNQLKVCGNSLSLNVYITELVLQSAYGNLDKV